MVLDDMASLQIHAEWGSLCQLAEVYVPAHRIFAVLRGGRKRIVCVAGPWPSSRGGEDRAIHVTRRLCWRVLRDCRARARGLADGERSRAREQVRVEALQYSVNASDSEQVLYRLRDAGIVSRVDYQIPSRGGRPPNRWRVNPRLTTTLSPGNFGNLGNLPGR
jgi:hypothetical protein